MIKEVFSENGEKTFTVRVSVRSKDQKGRVQKQRTGITTRARAKAVEKELLRIAHEEVIKRESLGLTWIELVDGWELYLRKGYNCGRKISVLTARDRISILRQFTGSWNNLPGASVSKGQIRAVMDEIRDRGLSASRQKEFKASINGLFEWAIETGGIKGVAFSPAIGLKVTKDTEKQPEILNLNEIRNFLRVAREHEVEWYPIWAFALLSGMRSGEIFALKFADVDFDSKRIMVSKSYNKRLGGVKSTKAGIWREVPISDELEGILKQVRATAGERQHVFPRIKSWERGEAANVLKKFCIGYGLKPIKFHTLRSCFATQLVKDGVAPAIVMKICGWRDLKTMQRYVRLAGIEVQGATESLKFLSPSETMENVVNLFRS